MNKNVAILSLTLIVVSLGFGMVIPVFPFLISDLGGGGTELGLLVAVAAATELLFGPMWGGLSDRIGRKPVLALGMFGFAVSLILFGIATELWMLYLFRALSGILTAAASSSAMAYVGDSIPQKERSGGMGILGAAGGLGLILGPGFGGALATVSLPTPFFAGAGIALVTVPLVLAFLPESLPAGGRPAGNASERPNLHRAVSDLRRSPVFFLLFLAFLASFGLANFEAVFGLYGLVKFQLGPGEIGVLLTVIGLVSTLGKIFTGALTLRWGDPAMIKGSLLAGSIGFLVLLAASSYLTIILATGFFILSKTFLRPSVLSLTSRRATLGQGMTMGLSNSAMSLGRIAGPLWAGLAFDLDIHYPYLSGAGILFVGFLASLAALASRASPPARAGTS
ncbi:MAG: MFS transporter [Anaerolineales bacterium]|nr:MFS transporter [Anaerolineales bacterium]